MGKTAKKTKAPVKRKAVVKKSKAIKARPARPKKFAHRIDVTTGDVKADPAIKVESTRKAARNLKTSEMAAPQQQIRISVVAETPEVSRNPQRPANIVSILDNLAYLLENDSDAPASLNRQDLLHGVDPTLARSTRFMPKGATDADVWVIRHGDPLTSINAAFDFLKIVEGLPTSWVLSFNFARNLYSFTLNRVGGKIEAIASSIPAVICAAALKFQMAKDEK
jgi:hypothetical protein